MRLASFIRESKLKMKSALSLVLFSWNGAGYALANFLRFLRRAAKPNCRMPVCRCISHRQNRKRFQFFNKTIGMAHAKNISHNEQA